MTKDMVKKYSIKFKSKHTSLCLKVIQTKTSTQLTLKVHSIESPKLNSTSSITRNLTQFEYFINKKIKLLSILSIN